MNILKRFLILSFFIIFLFWGFLSSTYAENDNSSSGSTIKEFLKIFFPSSSGFQNNISQLSADSPNNNQLQPQEAISVKSLRELFSEIEKKVQIPARIIEGVMLVESPGLLNPESPNFLTDEQVQEYSRPGAVIPGCRANACSAMGPMQMTTGIDNSGSSSCSDCGLNVCPNAWAGFGDSVNTFGGYSHLSNPCNLRDNIYAAAAKLKDNSGAGSGVWTKEQVYRAAERYYGSCSDKYRYERLDNKTYCEFLWWYYTGQD
ncbi:MAG: hypothetical protein HYW86_01190 [Candidatus Roizmanbacteria bacterium]|nr:MAG: hypothetical protein HYW86_01190 [Candidatus Roizmanbacteria bacterium]